MIFLDKDALLTSQRCCRTIPKVPYAASDWGLRRLSLGPKDGERRSLIEVEEIARFPEGEALLSPYITDFLGQEVFT